MRIFCINSVKGGSGKTTLSLSILYNRALAYMTQQKQRPKEEEEQQEKHFAYIDLDLQGTGVSRIIFGEEDREKLKFMNSGTQSKRDDYRDLINTFPDYEDEVKIDAFLLNDSDDAKKIYGVKNKEMLESRNVNRFKEYAKELIDQIVASEAYDTMVLDCSPSYDYIASDLYEYICRRYHDSKNTIFNIFVTTLDKSHVYTTISKIRNILTKAEYNIGMYVVCNDINGKFNSGGSQRANIEEKTKFKDKVYEGIRKAGLVFGKKTSEIEFSKDHIIIMEGLDIQNEFIFSSNATLNQRDILKKLNSDNLADDLGLRNWAGVAYENN